MAKTQVNLRLDDAAARMAREAAQTRHLAVNEYVEQLIRADNESVRESFLAGAQQVLEEFGDLLDDLEATA